MVVNRLKDVESLFLHLRQLGVGVIVGDMANILETGIAAMMEVMTSKVCYCM